MASSDAGNGNARAAKGGTTATTAPTATDNGSVSLTAATAATAGMSGIAQLTGKQAEGVTAVEPTSSGWIISVEVLEDKHVPSSADILATYEAELGPDGTLLAYHRTTRYPRGRGDGGRMRS